MNRNREPDKWYYRAANNKHPEGPHSLSSIAILLSNGLITTKYLVSIDCIFWEPLHQVPELLPQFLLMGWTELCITQFEECELLRF